MLQNLCQIAAKSKITAFLNKTQQCFIEISDKNSQKVPEKEQYKLFLIMKLIFLIKTHFRPL